MPDYSLRAYDPSPRGLASNNGFEAEDRARAMWRAQNHLNSRYRELIALASDLASMIWQQEKARHACNERDFTKRFVEDIDMVAREHAKDGMLPDDVIAQAAHMPAPWPANDKDSRPPGAKGGAE